MKNHNYSIALLITFFVAFFAFYGAITAYSVYYNTQAVFEEKQAARRLQ